MHALLCLFSIALQVLSSKETYYRDYKILGSIRSVLSLINFFEEVIDKLDIRECNEISDTIGYPDPVETAIKKYEDDPSIVCIIEKFNLMHTFNLEKWI